MPWSLKSNSARELLVTIFISLFFKLIDSLAFAPACLFSLDWFSKLSIPCLHVLKETLIVQRKKRGGAHLFSAPKNPPPHPPQLVDDTEGFYWKALQPMREQCREIQQWNCTGTDAVLISVSRLWLSAWVFPLLSALLPTPPWANKTPVCECLLGKRYSWF